MRKTEGLYYSGHHLARDLFWNAGNFTFFLVLGAVVDKSLRIDLQSAAKDLANLQSASLAIAAGIAYLAMASVSGLMATRLFIVAVTPFKYTPLSRFISYDGWYDQAEGELTAFYNKVFGDAARELIQPRKRNMDLIVRLTSYMRIYNEPGYTHVHRTYSMVSLYRQGIVYLLIILSLAINTQSLLGATLLLGLLLFLFVALWHSLRYAVTREFAFLVATFHSVLGQSKTCRHKENVDGERA